MINYAEIPVDLDIDRDKFHKGLNDKVGKGDWFWGFRVSKRLYSWSWGLQLYEDAYFEFLKKEPAAIGRLVNHSDAFVYDRRDTDSVLDYKKQNQPRDHFQDIALRRCLVRFGVWFKGVDLLRVPGSEFDDSSVKFHLPHLIHKPDSVYSIRSWLSNRLIVVAKSVEDKAKLADVLVK